MDVEIGLIDIMRYYRNQFAVDDICDWVECFASFCEDKDAFPFESLSFSNRHQHGQRIRAGSTPENKI